LVRDELCGLFGLDREKVRVLTARVGGGFGSKQELLTEDLVALAVLRTGRPVQHEFTRTVELTAAPCRHPMSVTVRVGANTDGLLTALAIDVLADAGAYGNHSPGVMFHGCHESMGMYRFPISGSTPGRSTPTTCRLERSVDTGSGRSFSVSSAHSMSWPTSSGSIPLSCAGATSWYPAIRWSPARSTPTT
jgi:hypothetical protein